MSTFSFCSYSLFHPAAAAKSFQSWPTLCDPIDSNPPGSTVPGILQARTLEWVAISFSNAGKWKVKVKSLSHVWLFTTQWTAAHQAPPPMGFSRQEYRSGVPLPSPNSFTLRCWKYRLLTFPVLSETKTCLFKQPIHSWEHLKGACWGTFILLKCFTLYYLSKEWNTHWIWWCQPMTPRTAVIISWP